MNNPILKLVPRPQPGYSLDWVEIRDADDNPIAIMHVDAFWHENGTTIHDALYRDGRTVTVELMLCEE